MVFHEYLYNKKEIIEIFGSNGFRIEYCSPCSIIWGLLEVPCMNKIYRLLYGFLQNKDKPPGGHGEGFDKTGNRSLLKDVFIYEKRKGTLKYFFVSLFGYVFGNLFLVVCRKV